MDPSIPSLLPWIPALPLAAALLTALLGPRVLRERSGWPVVLGIAGSCVLSLVLAYRVGQAAASTGGTGVGWEQTVDLWTWADVTEALPAAASAKPVDAAAATPTNLPLAISITLRADALTAMMLSMVTFVSTLVAIYACGYMRGDRGYWRFFTYIGLFVFSMTMLVSVSNFVLLYVFWEAVGVCSYLLIGFWYEKPAAAAAGKKAFLVNRMGDFGFALGLFLIWTTYGTLNFHDADGVAGVLGQTRLASPTLLVGGDVATAICLLLLLGACGKSAQFPLHVWLPDAMEGPTPVSALIHAATMVTAGVYLVARCAPLFAQSETALATVSVIGVITALIGGVIAMTQTDLKRVLAYSTISQLGFMFLGLGVGTLAGIYAGMFHLFTHAFFKALLFLGAGSVMHAMGGAIDMRRFGGLARIMPYTRWTFLIGALALAGVLPFAGFWSKDAILGAVHDRAHDAPLYGWLYYLAMFVAFLTALYTFRAYFLTFHGRERIAPEAGHHAHESPPVMTIPLLILAVGAVVLGAYFESTGGLEDYLKLAPSLAFAPLSAGAQHGGFHYDVAAQSTVVALSGVALAAFLFLGPATQAQWLAARLEPLYWLSHGKLFFDELYRLLVVWPLQLLARSCALVDRWLIDGLVDRCGGAAVTIGGWLRALGTGMVQFYALAMVLGLLVLIGTLCLL